MAIRSGRFTGDATQILVGTKKGLPIIDGHGGTYRIFNSGYTEFQVALKGITNVTLPPNCSVDVRPGKGDVFIRKTAGGDKLVEGIYEFLSEHSEVRTGRFSKATGTLTLISQANAKPESVLYRIMNSGDVKFKVSRQTATNTQFVTDLRPKTSVDVELAGTGLEVDLTADAKGIYFHLDQTGDVKSGRFKIDPKITSHPAPNKPHIIIDTLPQGKNQDAYYRVFNSGEHPFNLVGLDDVVRIVKGMSYDFKVAKAKAVVSVQGLNVNDAIEGSFDFVEQHN